MVAIAAVFVYAFHHRFIRRIQFENPIERLMFFNFIAMFIGSIGMAIAKHYCQFQTVIIESGDMSCVFMGAWFAWDLWTIVHKFRMMDRNERFTVQSLADLLGKREIFYIGFAYPQLNILAYFKTSRAPKVPRNLWCWVGNNSSPLGIAFFLRLDVDGYVNQYHSAVVCVVRCLVTYC
ncbi:hypothetical protein BC938DRAFT_482412 [Jimgerdemannia flammicorona]|uniref:Uncharacterized protein n=1 Tax=Jimgerdemannia flammicorona TaxID=994334 RepID=A0A433QWD1_9FUNG|nr:hypothetical protein BC938DRAFT_482412 [Jimgerdemannia flammicorona]